MIFTKDFHKLSTSKIHLQLMVQAGSWPRLGHGSFQVQDRAMTTDPCFRFKGTRKLLSTSRTPRHLSLVVQTTLWPNSDLSTSVTRITNLNQPAVQRNNHLSNQTGI